jgi:hypothetical protein
LDHISCPHRLSAREQALLCCVCRKAFFLCRRYVIPRLLETLAGTASVLIVCYDKDRKYICEKQEKFIENQ